MEKDQKLSLIFLVLALPFMIVPAHQNYPPEAAIFPQLTSGAVILGCTVVLLRDVLPAPLSEIVTRDVSLSGDSGESSVLESEEESSSSVVQERFQGTIFADIDPSAVTATMTVVFIGVGYAVSFLIAVPAFVASYLYLYDGSPLRITGVVLLTVLIVLGFIEFANAPFDEGEILFEGGIGWL